MATRRELKKQKYTINKTTKFHYSRVVDLQKKKDPINTSRTANVFSRVRIKLFFRASGDELQIIIKVTDDAHGGTQRGYVP